MYGYNSSYLRTYRVTTTTIRGAAKKRYKHKSLSQISCPQWISPPTRTIYTYKHTRRQVYYRVYGSSRQSLLDV